MPTSLLDALNILAPTKQFHCHISPTITFLPYLSKTHTLPQCSTLGSGACLLGVDMLGCDVLSVVILIDSGVVGIRIFLAGMLGFAKF